VAFKAPWARLESHTPKQRRVVKLVNEPNGKISKQFEVDGHRLARLPLGRTVPMVLFEPTHLMLLHGPPDLRRGFLDDLLEQTITGYGGLRRDYRRALSQRNHLLKRGLAVANQQLFAWNIRLSELGGQIAQARVQLIEQFNKSLGKTYSQLADRRHKVTLQYETSCDPLHYSSQLLKRLEQNIDTDIDRGFTSHGPLLALKLLEVGIVEKQREQAPLLLLDDVFSELDGKRRRALTDVLQDHQSFITTTDADVVVQHFMGNCHIIPTNKE
jgi:DNA replication and repair protein RecF